MRILELRHAKGLTHKQVADKAGISEAAISLYERGLRKPTILTAYKLAEALGVTVDELIRKAG